MEKSTTVDVHNFQEDKYSNIVRNFSLQLNVSTFVLTLSPLLGDIEYKEFVRRSSDFAILIILLLIGTVGNAHTILVYWRVSDMRERFHIRTLIIWLSAVDLTTCAVVMPFEAIAIRFSYSISSNAACKLFRSVAHITIVSSWLILTVIGHERYTSIHGVLVAAKSGVHSTTCTITSWLKRKTTFFQHNLVCFLLIISSSLLSTPTFFLLGIETVPLNNSSLFGTECTTHRQYRGILTAGLYGMAIGVFGLSCFVYQSYCYGKTIYLIYEQFKKEKMEEENTIHLIAVGHYNEQTDSYRKRKPHYKMTISLIVAAGVSLCGFILYSIGAGFGGAHDSSLKHAVITGVLKRGCFINNACNPVIYFIWDNQFRHACKKLYLK